MPETTFAVRWPDGAVQRLYSPSLVVHEHLPAGSAHSVSELVARGRTALEIASERVRAAHGFPCSRAADSLQRLESAAARYPSDAVATVKAGS